MTDFEKQKTIDRVKKRLAERAISKPVNVPVKTGYTLALEVLEGKITTLEEIASRTENIQARCIAWLAMDYLKGECTAKALLGVPLKKGK